MTRGMVFPCLFLTMLSMPSGWGSAFDAISCYYDLIQPSKVLNFIKRNLYSCLPNAKRTAYLRPNMEYDAPVWDSYYNFDI